jgi:hypothetical protein
LTASLWARHKPSAGALNSGPTAVSQGDCSTIHASFNGCKAGNSMVCLDRTGSGRNP